MLAMKMTVTLGRVRRASQRAEGYDNPKGNENRRSEEVMPRKTVKRIEEEVEDQEDGGGSGSGDDNGDGHDEEGVHEEGGDKEIDDDDDDTLQPLKKPKK
jgi:hypothetical protein